MFQSRTNCKTLVLVAWSVWSLLWSCMCSLWFLSSVLQSELRHNRTLIISSYYISSCLGPRLSSTILSCYKSHILFNYDLVPMEKLKKRTPKQGIYMCFMSNSHGVRNNYLCETNDYQISQYWARLLSYINFKPWINQRIFSSSP